MPVKITVNVSGAYSQLMQFLRLLAKTHRIVVVNNLSISAPSASSGLTAQLTAQAFYNA